MSTPWYAAICCAVVACALLAGVAVAAETAHGVTPELRQRAVETLRSVLRQEQEWAKVHAAEFLLTLDYPQGVRDAFLEELAAHGKEPKYRLGIWRVLVRATADDTEATQWKTKIRDVAADPAARDRLHALESLAKLGYKISSPDAMWLEEIAREPSGAMAPFAAWVLVNSGWPGAEARLADLLDSPDAKTRGIAAYALRHVRDVSPRGRQKLMDLVTREPAGSEARIHVVCAAAVCAPEGQKDALRAAVVAYAKDGPTSQRYQACETLGRLATDTDLPMLGGFLSDSTADIRSSAAAAILHVGHRAPHYLGWIDWQVIGLFALGLFANPADVPRPLAAPCERRQRRPQ